MSTRINYNRQQSDPYATKGRYIHRAETGWDSYYQGWYQGSTKTYRKAAQSLFPARNHGYPIAYYLADYQTVLCADCMVAEFLNDPTVEFQAELCDGDARYERSTDCDGCNAEIDPQACPHCGDAISEPCGGYWRNHNPAVPELPLAIGENYHAIHARCLADVVASGKATKTGKLTYQVTDEWFDGTYTVGGQWS